MSIVQWLWLDYQPQKYIPDVQPLKVSERYAYVEVSQKALQLQCRAWQAGRWGIYRSVCIQAPKIEIINTFFFPNEHWRCPILALQAVVLSHQPQIFIIDMPFLLDKSDAYILNKYQYIRTTLKDLLNETEMPEWYQQCRSSYDICRRPQHWEETQRLCTAYLNIAQQFWQWLPQTQLLNSTDTQKHFHNLQYYKDFHRLNTSGLKLLQQSFGEEWTEEFLKYFYA